MNELKEFQAKTLLHEAILKTLIQYLVSRKIFNRDDFLEVYDAIVAKVCQSLDPALLMEAEKFRRTISIAPEEGEPPQIDIKIKS
jgi:hypothetical protein